MKPVSSRILILLLLLFLFAGTLRVAGLKWGMPDFEPVRQYHSALIARYLDHLGDNSLPTWKREIIDRTVQPIHEPPLMETLAIAGYRVLGGEQLWWPRALAAMAWLTAGFLLWRLLARLFEPGAALAGSAFFLLAPYGIQQSLSFQPDSLALALTLLGCLGILRFHQDPSRKHLLRAGILCAIAILVKTQMAFLIAGAYAALALRRGSPWRLVSHRENWLFALIALTPALLYVFINLQLGGISAQRGIIPASLLQPAFYISWLYNIDRVYGYPVFVLALLGTLLLRGDRLAMALGFWAGYLMLGMVFTFHYATHPYYHVSAFPAMAFGLSGLASPLIYAWQAQDRRFAWPGLALLAGLAVVLFLTPTARGYGKPSLDDLAPAYAEIGEHVEHSRRVLMLTESEGFPLMYHAMIAGRLWPNQWILAVERAGLQKIAERGNSDVPYEYDVEARFQQFAAERPEYFVVTALHEFTPALQAYLTQHYPLLTATDVYRIYDLRMPLNSRQSSFTQPPAP